MVDSVITPFTHTQSTAPDFAALVEFLVKPFLDQPESLRVDCELSQGRSRVWIRLAFDASDKGRVFGRGGRNIQAIRKVVDAVAKVSGYTTHLDIYGDSPHQRQDDEQGSGDANKPARRSSGGRPSSQSRPIHRGVKDSRNDH